MGRITTVVAILVSVLAVGVGVCRAGANAFVNWENAHVHPLDMTPDGTRLLAVNTADARLEVFDISSGSPVHLVSIPVGVDPVSVRAFSDTEVWVANHISDSVSIVDLTSMNVRATITTKDEPADIVFAGNPLRAFVTCSQENVIQVFDPGNLAAAPVEVAILGEDPRAMAVSPDGSTVYTAVFESGNGTTSLGGGADVGVIVFPPNVVNEAQGPYGGVNPPPNDGASFDPAQNGANPAPPRVGMIVKKDAAGAWMDDNGGDWTNLVSGPQAALSGRPVGWDLPDHDLAIIDANTLAVGYANRLMNICMAVGVNPATGNVSVIGTEATNEIRFEPVIAGRFIRVNLAMVDPVSPNPSAIVDLNAHLDYTVSTVPQGQRDQSIGDPRGIVWNAAGTRAYVSGMGSNNVVVVDAAGSRAGLSSTIEVGEGPTGVSLDESQSRLYVLNKFEASISTIDTTIETEVGRVSLFDPSPVAIKAGRKHLYDTHKNSGLGHIACGSCHIDSRMDRLAWDLGAPDGDMKVFNQNCNLGIGALGNCEDWHPMKGPMTTQTLQDIIGKEPLHWRGDRDGIEEFNDAFIGLQGDDENLSPQEMQEFEDFLATITFPPNPFRAFDNSLPTNLPLPGHFTTGRFGAAAQPLPNGNAQAGLLNYRTGLLDSVAGLGSIQCVTCHTLSTGAGTNRRLVGAQFQPFPGGPNGEDHLAIVSVDGSTNVSIKVPHLRNLYEKVGFDTTQTINTAGFGFLHDGSVDSIARFVNEPVFDLASDQETADMVAFMLAFSGSDLPIGSFSNVLELRGPNSLDTRAAVGAQVTFDGTNNADAGDVALLQSMMTLANSGDVGLIAKGVRGGELRGYEYVGPNAFQSDRSSEAVNALVLRNGSGQGEEMTFTVVPNGTQRRMGIDRDTDGFLDRDELDACANPADAASTPNNVVIAGDFDVDADVDIHDFSGFLDCYVGPGGAASLTCRCAFDFDQDGDVDWHDFLGLQLRFTGE